MNYFKLYLFLFVFLFTISIGNAQMLSALNGSFNITGIDQVSEKSWEIKGDFTDTSGSGFTSANIQSGDRLIDSNGNSYEIVSVGQSDGKTQLICTSLENSLSLVRSIGTGILFHPSKKGISLAVVDAPALLAVKAMNSSLLTIDAKTPVFSSGPVLPVFSYSIGDVVLNSSDNNYYLLNMTGWNMIASTDIPQSYEADILSVPPGDKGDMIYMYFASQYYCFNGTEWIIPTIISSIPEKPNYGDVFYVTGEQKIYMYSADSEWVGISGASTPGGSETDMPTINNAGDLFFNTDRNILYVYYSSGKWVEVSTNGSVPSGIFNPDPATVTVNPGDLFYNTSDHKLYVYNGTVWMPSDNILPNGQIYVGNTTNIATAVTMSGDATINNSGKLTVVNKAITDDKLDKLNIPLSGFGNPTDNVSLGDGTTNNRLINLANPTGAQDAATKNYVDALFTNPTALLSLPSGNFFVGNLTNKAVATSKNAIPLSGFAAAAADVAVGGFKLTNVANPTGAQDAATKNYVDTKIIDPANITLASTNLLVGNASGKATAVTKNTIPLSGFGNPAADVSFGDGTVNYKIINLANPLAAQDAATKNYVDTKAIDAASLNLAAGSMFVGNGSGKATAVLKSAIPLSGFAPATADVALGNGTLNFKITNLLDPTTDQDAATKKYVDGLFSAPSTNLALANGKIFVGNASGKAVASATSTIPVSGFGKATATLNMGDPTTQYNISYLAEPLFPQDAATKNYVDSKSSGTGSISSTDLDISGGNNATMTDVVLSLRDNSITDAKLDKANIPLSGFAPAEGDIELGNGTTNYKIINLATPISGDPASTAATKGYVDNAVYSSFVSGNLYQGTVADLNAFMNLGWSGISSATLAGTGISGTICTLSQTGFTWIAYPKVWGNQDFFYKYEGETYAVFSGFQKRIIPASATGSVDYQVLIFLTTPDREVSLIAGN